MLSKKHGSAHRNIFFNESQHRFHTIVRCMTKLDAIKIPSLQLLRKFTFVGALLIGFCSSHDSYADENVGVADVYHVHL